MSSRRRNLICVLFSKVPEGTRYRKGQYSWINEPEALDYIKEGYGKEFDPKAQKVSEKEAKKADKK